ncbi:hypothetical protein ACHAWF_009954 [Thalassiosira exigua]
MAASNESGPFRDFSVAKVPAGVAADRLSCRLSPSFDRRSHPTLEDAVDRTWRARVAANPRLFNGSKFRLKAMRVVPAPDAEDDDNIDGSAASSDVAVALDLGLTDYRSHLGTNASPDLAARLIEDGLEVHGDAEACLSMKLGVGAVTRTADGHLAFILRSDGVAEARGMLDVPGGHPEPERIGLSDAGALSRGGNGTEVRGEGCDELCERAAAEVFDSALDEVVAETNAPRESLGGEEGSGREPTLLGLVRQLPTAGTPSLAFEVRCSLTREELAARYDLGPEEAYESSKLVFARESDLIGRMGRRRASDGGGRTKASPEEECAAAVLRLEREEMAPMRFTPSTRGCLTLWLMHQRYHEEGRPFLNK